jgi:ABC-type amino acid transport substrate-binding protein
MKLAVAFALTVLILLSGCGGSDDGMTAGERRVLRVGTDATYPPFEFANEETGKPDGFDVDLVKAVCR